MSDLIDRQAAIDAVSDRYYKYDRFAKLEELVWSIKGLPSVQPEDCDTCKHGCFGDSQCENCRVRYPSHYERRTDETD